MLIRALVLAAAFVATLGYVAHASHSEPIPMRAAFAAFPMQIDEWRGRPDPPLTDAVLAILGVDDYISRTYFTRTAVAGLYSGYWRSQRQGDTIHSPLNCLPGAGWEPVSKRDLQLQVPTTGGQPRDITINRYVIQKGLDRQMVLYWYQSHGRVVASEYVGKFFLVKDAIQLNRTDAALVRVVVPILGADTAAEDRAERDGARFIKLLFPVMSQYLPS